MSNAIEVGAFEAKTRLSALLEKVQAGQSFYITKHGKRVAELRPVTRSGPRPKRGCGKGWVAQIADDFDQTPPDFKEYGA